MRQIPVTIGFNSKGVGMLILNDDAADLLDSDNCIITLGGVSKHDRPGVFVNIVAIVPKEKA